MIPSKGKLQPGQQQGSYTQQRITAPHGIGPRSGGPPSQRPDISYSFAQPTGGIPAPHLPPVPLSHSPGPGPNPGGLPHDMNKQAHLAGQAGLPTGGVHHQMHPMSFTVQQSVARTPAQVNMRWPSGPGGTNSSPFDPQQPAFYSRSGQSNPRLQNARQHQYMPGLQPTNQQVQFTHQHVPGIYVPQVQPNTLINHLPMGGNSMYPQSGRHPTANYNYSGSQPSQIVYPPYAYPAATYAYLQQQQHHQQQQSANTMPRMPIPQTTPVVQQPQQSHVPRRRSNALEIIDPDTGRNVLEDYQVDNDRNNVASPNSTEASTSESPNNSSNAVVLEFATKVAKAAAGDSTNVDDSSRSGEDSSRTECEEAGNGADAVGALPPADLPQCESVSPPPAVDVPAPEETSEVENSCTVDQDCGKQNGKAEVDVTEKEQIHPSANVTSVSESDAPADVDYLPEEEEEEHQQNGEVEDLEAKSNQKTKAKRGPAKREPVRRDVEPLPGEAQNSTVARSSSPVETPDVPVVPAEETCEDVLSNEEPDVEVAPVKIGVQLKHNYEEDQWSPLNRDGKKKYGREFLLGFQDLPHSQKKPDNLPELDIIKDFATSTRPRAGESRSMTLGKNTGYDFTPNYVKSSSRGPVKRNSQQGRLKLNKPPSVNLSLREEVKLHEAENAWKPRTLNTKTEKEEESDQKLYNRVRGILNKLTPQNLPVLVTQFNELEITTEHTLTHVISLVFEKSVDEPNFSASYAQLCKELAMLNVPTEDSLPDKQVTVNFRKLLLIKCQQKFEQDWAAEESIALLRKQLDNERDEVKKKELAAVAEEKEQKARKRSLGNIRFIGELFKLGMLTGKIMHECITKLLRNPDDEDSLECLCRLLTTIGKKMEEELHKKTSKSSDDMDHYFVKMKEVVEKRHVSSRVRFMLQDVIDLRANNWTPRRDDNNPKTIAEIHKEAEKEAIEEQIMLQQNARRNDDRKKRGPSMASAGEDGWNTAGGRGTINNRLNYDENKFASVKNSMQQNVETDNIQLGPITSFTKWGCGSSTGSKMPAGAASTECSDSKGPRFAPNKFSMLDSSRRATSLLAPPGRPLSQSRDVRTSGRPSLSSQAESRGRDKERASVLAAVRAIPSDGNSKSRSEQSSRESSVAHEEMARTPTEQVPGGNQSNVDLDRARAQTHIVINEYLSNCDLREAVVEVKERLHPALMAIFVEEAMNLVLERTDKARADVGKLLCELVKQSYLLPEQFAVGLKQVLSYGEDTVVDIPKVWEYITQIIAPPFECEVVCLTILRDCTQVIANKRTAATFVAGVLHQISQKMGETTVSHLWKQLGLSWTDFLDANDDISKFVIDHRVHYTLDNSMNCQSAPMEEVKRKMKEMLKNRSEVDKIFDWIDVSVGKSTKEPTFIRALTTVICENAISFAECPHVLQDSVLKSHQNILQRYLDNNDKLEVQCLYAVQELMHHLEHPQGMLCKIFETLYDSNVISEDAFRQWQNSKDSEVPGKGVALKSVTRFFTWLAEAEEDDEDDEQVATGS